MTVGLISRSIKRTVSKKDLNKLRSYFALLKANTGSNCNIVPNAPAIQLTDSFGSVRTEWRHNLRSRNHLDSCKIFPLAPIDFDFACVSARCCPIKCLMLSRYQGTSISISLSLGKLNLQVASLGEANFSRVPKKDATR